VLGLVLVWYGGNFSFIGLGLMSAMVSTCYPWV